MTELDELLTELWLELLRLDWSDSPDELDDELRLELDSETLDALDTFEELDELPVELLLDELNASLDWLDDDSL